VDEEAKVLLDRNSNQTEEDIKEETGENPCRCGIYLQHVKDALEAA